MRKLKYILDDFRWVKALFSPFKPFKIKWYVGKTQVGVPYFFPRKTVKFNEQDIQEAIAKHKANKNYIQYDLDSKLYDMYKNYSKFVPLKVGFSYCSLGWKTKWDEYDIRYEYGPVISFVFFGYQIAMMVGAEHASHYWESWICYEYKSNKKQRTRKRVAFCRRKCPQKWISRKDGVETTTNYWDLILKDKYLYKTQNDHK